MTDAPLLRNVRALSLDVFDTALTRCWARPEHAHMACAHHLREAGLIQMDDSSWLALRRAAEQDAVKARGPDLATLTDVYGAIERSLGWRPEQSTAAQGIECDVEAAGVWPVPALQALWRRARDRAIPIRFLSDMYLPAATVQRLLLASGYQAKAADVWVSCERGASKSSGALFRALIDAAQVEGRGLLHVGDNRVSDIEQAQRAGLQTVHADGALLSCGEQAIADTVQAPLLLRSLIAGVVKVARLNDQGQAAQRENDDVRSFGREHAGPLLTLYVWWLLQDAQQRPLKRLYFLARDGQVLLEIARCLQQQGWAKGIELRYLHGSRQAWFAASIVNWNADDLFRILDESNDRFSDLQKLALRLGFEDAEDLHLQWPEATQACAAASNNRAVAQALVMHVPAAAGLAHTARLREVVLRYLAQEGIAGSQDFGIVDLGWRGRMQQTLERILAAATRAHSPAHVHGYYIALLESLPDHSASTLLRSSVGRPVVMPAPAHLFEMLCEADHGTTRGYVVLPDGRAAPQCRPTPDPHIQAWGLEAYRAGLLGFAAVFAKASLLLPPDLGHHDAIEPMFRALARHWMHTATPQAMRAFARMPTTYSSAHGRLHELAPALRTADAWLRALSLGRLRMSRRHTPWVAGSLARTGQGRTYMVYRWLWRWAARLKQLAHA